MSGVTCYWRAGGTSGNSSDWAGSMSTCGPFNSSSEVLSCCFNGETCLSDGICQYEVNGKSNLSGYRVAACTDSTYKDSLCKQWCGNVDPTDIVYNPQTQEWSCCSSGIGGANNPNCFNLTSANANFSAPGPSDLEKVFSIPNVGFSPTTRIPTATASSSAAASSGTQAPASTGTSSSGGLSTGGAIGVGVGLGVGAVALGLVAALLFWRRRRNRLEKDAVAVDHPAQYKPPPSEYAQYGPLPTHPSTYSAELKPGTSPSSVAYRTELPVDERAGTELPATETYRAELAG